MKEDELYMHRCIQLARNGLCGAPPNPMVGAVIVCDGKIIGETTEDRVPALIGGGASLLCLVLFGAADFLIPAMVLIALLLCLYTGRDKEVRSHE